jgi:hypothetical protein
MPGSREKCAAPGTFFPRFLSPWLGGVGVALLDGGQDAGDFVHRRHQETRGTAEGPRRDSCARFETLAPYWGSRGDRHVLPLQRGRELSIPPAGRGLLLYSRKTSGRGDDARRERGVGAGLIIAGERKAGGPRRRKHWGTTRSGNVGRRCTGRTTLAHGKQNGRHPVLGIPDAAPSQSTPAPCRQGNSSSRKADGAAHREEARRPASNAGACRRARTVTQGVGRFPAAVRQKTAVEMKRAVGPGTATARTTSTRILTSWGDKAKGRGASATPAPRRTGGWWPSFWHARPGRRPGRRSLVLSGRRHSLM